MKRLLLIAGIVVLLAQLFYWLPEHATRDASTLDVPGYYRAAKHVLAGEPLYRDAVEHVFGAYIYPPTFAVLIYPLALLGPATFQAVWYFGILLSFWLYAAALVRLSGRAFTAEHIFAAGAVLLVVPGTTTTMSFGNIDLLVWAMCATSLLPGKSPWAGLAATFKLYPSWTLFTKPPRELLAGIGAAVAGLVVTVLVVGVRGFVDWFAVVRTLASGVDWHANISLSFRLAHALGHDGLTGVFSLVGTATAVVIARLSCRAAGAGVLVVAVALGPICWVHYAPVLLIPVAVMLQPRAT